MFDHEATRDSIEQPIKNAAMQYLARREHSRQELFTKLSQKFNHPLLINDVLDEAIEKGYLSDLRYADLVVRSRVNAFYGEVKIRHELRLKGVSEDIVDDVINDQRVDWNAIAREARNKRFGGSLPPQDYQEQAKEMRFLQRRGFTLDQISTIYG